MSFDPKTFEPDEYEHCAKHGKYVSSGLCAGIRYSWPMCGKCRINTENKKLVSVSRLPKSTIHCTFDNYINTSGTDEQAKVLQDCINYADSFKPDISHSANMVMLGNYGTGKNHLSTAIVKRVSKAGYSALHLQGMDYLDNYHGKPFSERQDWLKKLANVDLMVLDEVEKVPRTKGTDDAYFRLIQSRTMSMKPTIVITNETYEDLSHIVTQAGVDRLKDYDGIGLNFNWKSYRGKRK